MDAAVVHTFGQPPRCEEFPEPAAGEGEAIVQVRAAGLHPIVKALATEQVPLANVEDAWQCPATGGCRLVIIP